MAYTPELDRAASGFVRRLAWAINRPMTLVLEELVLHAAEAVDADKVCPACRDRSQCIQCYLNRPLTPIDLRLFKLMKDE